MPLDQLCKVLLRWAEDPSSGFGAFTLIGAMAALFQPFETQVLATGRVFELATAHLQYALDNVPTQHTADLWAPRVSARIYACAANLLHSLARSRPEVVEFILLNGGVKQKMHAIARRVQPYLDPQGQGDARDSCKWFTAVCARYGEAFVPSGGPEPGVSNVERGYLPNAWGLMVTYRSTKCARGGCASTAKPQESRACAGCGVARYCSTEHQREAWKAEHRPHKPMCTAIQALRHAIHMEDDDTWTRLIHNTQSDRAPYAFLALCEQYTVNPELGKAVLVAAGLLR
ncbi:hypothetical protein B0H12DRAFT_1102009 [Mycena haematopus]|nr:hypothetical protein B0H12DRAFT_1102009 [Mycena haematopus]